MSGIPKSNEILKKAKWFELVGLVLILIASFWQIFFISFFEENFMDSQNYTNEETFYDLLSGQVDIARMLVLDDLDKKIEKLNELSQRNGKRCSEIILARQKTFKIWREGAIVYQNIRIALFTIGSLLILIGKYLEIQSLRIGAIENDSIELVRNNNLITDKQSPNIDGKNEENTSEDINDRTNVNDEHVG